MYQPRCSWSSDTRPSVCLSVCLSTCQSCGVVRCCRGVYICVSVYVCVDIKKDDEELLQRTVDEGWKTINEPAVATTAEDGEKRLPFCVSLSNTFTQTRIRCTYKYTHIHTHSHHTYTHERVRARARHETGRIIDLPPAWKHLLPSRWRKKDVIREEDACVRHDEYLYVYGTRVWFICTGSSRKNVKVYISFKEER
jgi:hypothetical protein